MASDGGNSNCGKKDGTAGKGGQVLSEQDPKEGKKIFKFGFILNTKKATDATEMTQDFNNKTDEDAFGQLSHALFEFKSHVPLHQRNTFETLLNKMKSAGAARKGHQAIQNYHLRQMKRFHSDIFVIFTEQRKKFDEARRKMDLAKADVRDAKTTTAIEKKATFYQLAVDNFDQQTEELIKIIEALPKVKQGYIRDIFVVLTKHKLYHNDMSKYYTAS